MPIPSSVGLVEKWEVTLRTFLLIVVLCLLCKFAQLQVLVEP